MTEKIDEILGDAPDLEAEIAAYEAQNPHLTDSTEESVEDNAPEDIEFSPTSTEAVKEPVKEEKAETVPLPVFLEYKNEVKELRRELAELRSAKQATPPETPQEDLPPKFEPTVEYEDDPGRYLLERNEYLEKRLEWQERQLTGTRQMTEQQRAQKQAETNYNQFVNVVTDAENQFRASEPTYDDAVEFVKSSRYKEAVAVYEANGLQPNPQEIGQAITRELASLAANALQRGRNPAAVLYTLAKARGFSAKPDSSKAERLERGIERSKSISATPGSRPETVSEVSSSGDFFKDLQKQAGYRG